MKHILFIVSEDWYFVSHRLHLATRAIEEGYQVSLLTRISEHKDLIESYGIRVINWNFSRRSLNLKKEISSIKAILKLSKEIKPDIIHAVALKPVIYSSIAFQFSNTELRIFALGGLGFIFSSERLLAKLLRPFIIILLRSLFRGPKTKLILQNSDDEDLLLRYGVIKKDKIVLIRGSGVDTIKFSPSHSYNESKLVILPSRMLWDKGVMEFVQCAKKFKENNIDIRFCLVGSPDPHNPQSIPIDKINDWVGNNIIEWWGYQKDMAKVYSQASIVCLPSYREGLPKSLLEAASCGLPIVAFDVPGCREIVKNGVNGYLIPSMDIDAMYKSILNLANNSELSKTLGHNGRLLVLNEFSQDIIASQTLKVWSGQC